MWEMRGRMELVPWHGGSLSSVSTLSWAPRLWVILTLHTADNEECCVVTLRMKWGRTSESYYDEAWSLIARVFNRWPSNNEYQVFPLPSLQIWVPLCPSTVTLRPRNLTRWRAQNRSFRVLRRFPRVDGYMYRNSYRIEISHLYEAVSLNQIELMFNYSESETRFKAFIEHGLGWTLIAQSYFLWQPANAW